MFIILTRAFKTCEVSKKRLHYFSLETQKRKTFQKSELIFIECRLFVKTSVKNNRTKFHLLLNHLTIYLSFCVCCFVYHLGAIFLLKYCSHHRWLSMAKICTKIWTSVKMVLNWPSHANCNNKAKYTQHCMISESTKNILCGGIFGKVFDLVCHLTSIYF